MAFKKNTQAEGNQQAQKIDYNVDVIGARVVKDGLVFFDMIVNGVTIYGCIARDYVNEEGKEGTFINLPQYAATKDGNPVLDAKGKQKYYSHCFFPMSADLRKNIINKIYAALEKKGNG